MATAFTMQKRPGETRRVIADFSLSLLPGEALVAGQPSVVTLDLIKDGTTPSFLTGAPIVDVTNATVAQTVTGGSTGDLVELTFRSGITSLNPNGYEIQARVQVTDEPDEALMFASLSRLKGRLGIAEDDASLDENLVLLLTAASAYFRARTQRDVYYKLYQEAVYLDDDCDLTDVTLEHFPVTKVDKVVMTEPRGTPVEITDSTLWEFTSDGHFWFHSGDAFLRFPGKNVVHYRAGYPKVPADIEQCVLSIASVFYRAQAREGLSAEKIGQYSYTAARAEDMPFGMRFELADTAIEGVIKRYMRRDVL